MLSCSLFEKEPEIDRINNMDLSRIFELASYHSLTAMVAFSLERVIVLPYGFDQSKKKAIRKLVLYDIERDKIFSRMDQMGIWHMPLKGSILKDYYPEFGMREMVDNDILCDPKRMVDIRSIMEELGFTCEEFDIRVDDTYVKKPISFEIHRYLFDEKELKKYYDYYKDIKTKLKIVKEGCLEYRFTQEDFYIYMIAHMYKHFTHFGTGLRSLLDTFIFLDKQKNQLDWDYVFKELETLGLIEFEQMNRDLANRVFSDSPLSETDMKDLQYYLKSGAFGTMENLVDNNINLSLSKDDSVKAKMNYLAHRIFVSGDELKNNYSFFYKNKWLLPLFYFFRLIKAIFIQPKRAMNEYKKVARFKSSTK